MLTSGPPNKRATYVIHKLLSMSSSERDCTREEVAALEEEGTRATRVAKGFSRVKGAFSFPFLPSGLGIAPFALFLSYESNHVPPCCEHKPLNKRTVTHFTFCHVKPLPLGNRETGVRRCRL